MHLARLVKRLTIVICGGIVLIAGGSLWAQTDPVMKVELDWEVKIGEPDPGNGPPELSFVIAPVNNLDWTHGVFQLNSSVDAGYSPGGFENQIWIGTTLHKSHKSVSPALLSTTNELITFTQSMKFDTENGDSRIYFDIVNLVSTTWGTLGNGFVKEYRVTTYYSNLDGFSIETTVDESGVISGAARVTYMLLKQVRLTHQSGLIDTINTNQYVHQAVVGTVQTSKTINSTGAIVPR